MALFGKKRDTRSRWPPFVLTVQKGSVFPAEYVYSGVITIQSSGKVFCPSMYRAGPGDVYDEETQRLRLHKPLKDDQIELINRLMGSGYFSGIEAKQWELRLFIHPAKDSPEDLEQASRVIDDHMRAFFDLPVDTSDDERTLFSQD